MNKKKGTRLVYSSDHGRICPDCREPIKECVCQQQKGVSSVAKDGIVRVSRETKGRKGSGVTLVTGLALNPKDLKTLAKKLKQKCGCGGTINKGIIEIQGEQRDKLVLLLEEEGYAVKRVGG